MKGFDVLKVKSAVRAHNKFDLSRTHLTTMNFGEIVPLLAEEVIGGDKFSIDSNYFARLAPLVKPTFGKFSFKTVTGYVPYHMVAADAEAWIDGKTTWEGYTPHGRYFTVGSFHGFLKSTCVATTVDGVTATASNSVYTYVDTSGTTVYNLFTKVGKYYVKVLNALGYALPSAVDEQASSQWVAQMSGYKLSAYPLLAYFKLYNDYMSQSQRFNSSQMSNVLTAIKYIKAYTGIWNSATGEILPGALSLLFGAVRLQYENDYFTSAWQSPNSPINSVEGVSSVGVPFVGNLTDNVNNVYATLPVSNNNVQLPQRVLDFLKSFESWVRRNNYSGSRAVQQVYSRLGIKTSDYRDHYANVLSTDVIPISVGDVTATGPQFISAGDPNNVGLGDYAGKGIMSGNKVVSFQADDYGIVLVLGYFTVTPMNAFGNDRKVLRTAPLDFYTPEFDGLGADAISVGEYFADPVTPTVLDNAVYGYTERYNAYRYGRDQITGEFRDYTPSGDMNCWHTGRNMSTIRAAGQLVAQHEAVSSLPQTDSEYNRIFSYTGGDVDHFYLTAHFNVDAIRPMLNLNQVVGLGEGDTIVPRNGNVIS